MALTRPGSWYPQPKQREAINSPAFEILYGGEPGGGKTDLVLGLARTQHKESILFRRTYPRLEDTLIKRSRRLFGSTGRYNEQKHTYVFSDGCEIKYRAMEHASQMYDFASAEFDFVDFDEVTEFEEEPYLFLFSRIRSSNPGQRCRIMCQSNPLGEGVGWVRRRWRAWLDKNYPNPAKPGEIRYFRRDEHDADVECDASHPDALSRTFIKAGLKDNIFISAEEYRRRISAMKEPFRSAMLKGDWDAMVADGADQVIPAKWLRAAMDRWKPRDILPPFTCLGADPSRGGNDASCYAPRYANWWPEIKSVPGSETLDGASVIMQIMPYLKGGGFANLDVGGIGASPIDLARQQGMNVNGINFAEGTDERDVSDNFGFVNLRALMHWRTREMLDPERVLDEGEEPPEIFPDDELFADLIAPKFILKARGIQIEEKAEIKKRLGHSPNKGDAFVLTSILSRGPFSATDYLYALDKADGVKRLK